MSIINCSVTTESLNGYTGIRRTWKLFGIPVFSTVQVVQ